MGYYKLLILIFKGSTEASSPNEKEQETFLESNKKLLSDYDTTQVCHIYTLNYIYVNLHCAVCDHNTISFLTDRRTFGTNGAGRIRVKIQE